MFLILSFIPLLFRKYLVGPPFSCRCDHCAFTCPEKMPQMPMMTRTLKTADPTIVPTPTSPFVINTPKNIEQERVSNKLSAKSCDNLQEIRDCISLPFIQSYRYYLCHLNRNIASWDHNHGGLGNVLYVMLLSVEYFLHNALSLFQ